MSRSVPLARRAVAALSLTLVVTGGGLFLAPAASAQTACSDVEVVFARGSGEFPGLGIVGTPLVRSVQAALPDRTVTSYAVDYAAAITQTSAGPGATDMSRHIVAAAAQCPDQQYVVGGYSQGASVTTIAIGVPTSLGRGEAIPAELSDRIVAVAVFGNPLGLSRQTIAGSSDTYGDRAVEFCNPGDPVCGGTGTGPGSGHLTYGRDGSTDQAAAFVAEQLDGVLNDL